MLHTAFETWMVYKSAYQEATVFLLFWHEWRVIEQGEILFVIKRMSLYIYNHFLRLNHPHHPHRLHHPHSHFILMIIILLILILILHTSSSFPSSSSFPFSSSSSHQHHHTHHHQRTSFSSSSSSTSTSSTSCFTLKSLMASAWSVSEVKVVRGEGMFSLV